MTAPIDYGAGPAGVHVAGLSQERIVRSSATFCRRTMPMPNANRKRLARQARPRAQFRVEPRLGQDQPARARHRGSEGEVSHRRHRGRSADLQRRRAHSRDRRAGDPDQHRQGLPSRRAYGRPCDRRTAARTGGLLFIENVGNLVCPAAFDLGEAHKVVVLSMTEGEDKPPNIRTCSRPPI